VRDEYFTFKVESEPPPGPSAHLPPFSLAMSFKQLRAYDRERYKAFLPLCYGGQELSRNRSGCLGPLAPRAAQWVAENQTFLEHASQQWYHLVRELRVLARRHGYEP